MTTAARIIALFTLTLWIPAYGNESTGPADSIAEFTGDMSFHEGFLSYYLDERKGRLYLLLERDGPEMLYQSSLPRGVGSNDIGLDRGQLYGGRGAALVRFEPAGERVLLRRRNMRYRADSENALERRAAEEAFASSVLWGFPVKARDGDLLLVDATDFLLRDSHGVARRLSARGEGKYKTDGSRSALYLPRIRAFPENTELEAVVTLVGDNPGPQLRSVAADPYAITVHMHHSFIALPEPGYVSRRFHPESGYWAMVFADYAAPITESLEQRLIGRHRLQKKTPGTAPSEPVEPIVYYLDPGTPEPVRGALLDGARWWNQAFEAAGYIDAFRVEVLPEDADPMDVRYNVIQWVHRSTRGWSYGSSVVDPRSGEIIKGHVTLGSLRVRQDLLLARGMLSPFAEGGSADEKTLAMALARIRQLSAHEIGHTLGLAHNFAASGRDRESVMDYPYPQMVEADGEITLESAYATGIGEWDKRSILYGYGDFSGQDSEDDALATVLAGNRAQGFRFIADPDAREARDFHPGAHLWDNGGDPVEELERLLALRDRALQHFGPDSLPPGAPLSDLQEALVPIYFFHRYQVEAAVKLVGGADYRYGLRGEETGPAVAAVPPVKQQAALDALLRTIAPDVLALPAGLIARIPPKAYGYARNRESAPARTGELFDPLTLAEAGASHTLDALLHRERLARLALQHGLDGSQLSPGQLFQRLQDEILLPEYSGLAGEIDRRRGTILLRHWRLLLADPQAAPEVRAASRAALLRAQGMLRARQNAANAYADFYAYELWRIEQAMEQPLRDAETAPSPIPPGSPIGSAP